MAQRVQNGTGTATTSTSQALPARVGSTVRKAFGITNTHATSVLTIWETDDTGATAGSGIVLQPKQAFYESTTDQFECWQGQIQVIADASCTYAVFERTDING